MSQQLPWTMNAEWLSVGSYCGHNHGVITPLSWKLTPTFLMTQLLSRFILKGEHLQHFAQLDNYENNSQTWKDRRFTLQGSGSWSNFCMEIPMMWPFTSRYTTIFVAYQHFPSPSILFTWPNLHKQVKTIHDPRAVGTPTISFVKPPVTHCLKHQPRKKTRGTSPPPRFGPGQWGSQLSSCAEVFAPGGSNR